jgi:hypothetical protein
MAVALGLAEFAVVVGGTGVGEAGVRMATGHQCARRRAQTFAARRRSRALDRRRGFMMILE